MNQRGGLFRTKNIEQSIAETEEPEHQLKKDLGVMDLIVFGVGVIIGAGIFVITGTVAKTNAGPAITISFAIAGLACALAALCYAEFASTVPVAGSAYTFSYATFGELIRVASMNPPPPRRRATRSATCPAASSARSPS